LAQSYPVLPLPPWPVVSGGLSVPPASSEPVLLSTSHVFRQLWFSCAHPWLPHAVDGPVTLSTSCWSIWPTFSGKVIAPSSAFTRAWIGLCASSQGALPGCAEAAAWPMKTASAAAIKAPAATTNTAFLLLRTRPLACGVDMDSTSSGWG
jgi:hypothetical protein